MKIIVLNNTKSFLRHLLYATKAFAFILQNYGEHGQTRAAYDNFVCTYDNFVCTYDKCGTY